jgi:TolB-like protein/Tfp pilus assembly protein PilF
MIRRIAAFATPTYDSDLLEDLHYLVHDRESRGVRGQMDTAANRDRLRFGPFELHLRSRELQNGPTRIRLQDQPFEILLTMLERPGDVVTREELCQRLWPQGTFVDFEHSLNAAVKRLRSALGDDAENPRFVETLPRRGYRFIGALVAQKEPEPSSRPRLRLMVLPFVDLSECREHRYFADGLTEEMIAQLGHLCKNRIGVISRASSMTFKDSNRRARDIGETLGVDYLLEGSARREGERVRITARLVETVSETHLWVETYESQLADYLSVQTDVAARVARSLAMELMPDEVQAVHAVSSNAPAYHDYLKGRYYWNMLADEGVDPALEHFELATQLDPSFALAYVGKARVQLLKAEYYRTTPRPMLEAARQSVKRAMDLDPNLFEAHLALGEVRRMLEWDWRGAEAAYTQAIVLNPSHETAHRSYALLLAALARPAEAIRESDRALEMDPLCVVVNSGGAAWVRYLVGDIDGAIARSRRAVEMEPRYLVAHRVLAAAYLQAGRGSDAVIALETALALSPEDSVLLAWLAHARAVTGCRDIALALVNQLQVCERHLPSYHLALAHVGLGDRDAAFAALEQATVEADPSLLTLRTEPRFEPLRSDPRYTRLIELLGL